MATEFPAWLAALKAAGLLIDNVPPATRGLKWEEPLEVEGNWTTAAVEGSIRAAPDSDTVLATFTFGSPSYDSGTGFTTWLMSLASGNGANSTGVLPADADNDGTESFPFMVRLTPSGGAKDTLLGGLFPVMGYV